MARVHSSRYPLELAMSDVVQRCLEAGAGHVDLAVEFAGAQSWIRIATDVAPAVIAALEGAPSSIAAPRTLAGLDVIGACLTQGSAVSVSADGAAAGSTLVHLDGLHEVLAYKRQEGRVIETVVARMRGRISQALGLAFHRHLGGGKPDRAAVTITVNAQSVAPRHPFPPEAELIRPQRRELPFVVDGRVETVRATSYVLVASGGDPARGRQGFFVYVRDRLVQTGGWSRLSIRDCADALVRVAVDLPSIAVDAFTWEAAAHRVLFPPPLVPALRAVAFEAAGAGALARTLGVAAAPSSGMP